MIKIKEFANLCQCSTQTLIYVQLKMTITSSIILKLFRTN